LTYRSSSRLSIHTHLSSPPSPAFFQAPIHFPPSFRWVRGVKGGDFTALSLLDQCYTLKAHSKKSGWTPRPPSYTGKGGREGGKGDGKDTRFQRLFIETGETGDV